LSVHTPETKIDVDPKELSVIWDAQDDSDDDDDEEEEEEEEERNEEKEREDGDEENEGDAEEEAVAGQNGVCKRLGAILLDASLLGLLRNQIRLQREAAGIRNQAVDDGVDATASPVGVAAAEEADEIDAPADPADAEVERLHDQNKDGNERKDLVAFCVRKVKDLLEDTNFGLGRDGQKTQPEYVLAENVDISVHNRIVEKGWALRSKRGKAFGSELNELYLPVLAQYFIDENENVQHHAWYLQRLKNAFPRRLDHPTEQDVKRLKLRFLRYRHRVTAYNNTVAGADRIDPDYMAFLVRGESQIPGGIGKVGSQLPEEQVQFI